MSDELTHLDEDGHARMVDVAQKEPSAREASARATVLLEPDTVARLRTGHVEKGDVFAVARVAGISAAKKTWELIPLCHQVALTSCEVKFELDDDGQRVHVHTVARCTDRTGVEMEALVAASVAALTIYDMVKAIDRGATIENVQLTKKRGGRSGDWTRA